MTLNSMPKKEAAKDEELKIIEKKAKEFLEKESKAKPTKTSFSLIAIDLLSSRKAKTALTFSLFILLFTMTLLLAYASIKIKNSAITSFDQCTESKGASVTESYPSVCITKKGRRFIEEIPKFELELLESRLDRIDALTGWKVYKNESYGFEISYPISWYKEESNVEFAGNDYSFSLKPAGESKDKPLEIMVRILSGENAGSRFAECCVSGKKTETIGSNEFYTSDPSTLNGLLKWQFQAGNEDHLVEFSLAVGGENDPPPAPKPENYIKIYAEFREILSTFRFIAKNVQGANTVSCLESEKNLLEDISDCKKVDEIACLKIKAEYNLCFNACRKETDEDECRNICKPVCEII